MFLNDLLQDLLQAGIKILARFFVRFQLITDIRHSLSHNGVKDHVGAAVVCSHADKPLEIFESNRSTLPYEDRDTNATAAGIVSLLNAVIEKTLADYSLQKKHTEPIDGVFAIIRAPWTNSRTLHVQKNFETDTVITEALISELAQEALKGDAEHKDEIFETTVMRVELNGYPTAKPLGKIAHQVNVWVLVSEWDSQISKGVSASFAKFFPGQKPVLRSGVRADVSVLQETEPDQLDYLIVDMAATGSNIVTVINGVALAHELVTEGIYTILARIGAKRLPEETLSMLRMVAHNEGNDDVTNAMNLAMSIAEPDMVKVFGESMSALSMRHRLPNKLVIFSQPELTDWLSKFFERIDFVQFTQTTQPFSVEVFSVHSLARQISTAAELATDVSLFVACALVHIEQ